MSAWTSLAGVVLGFVGSQFTQLTGARRDRKREQRAWAREDAARSYEHRRDSYVAFVEEYHRYGARMAEVNWSYEPEPPEDWISTLYDRLVQIDIFGTKEAAKLAKDAYDAMARFGPTDQGLNPEVLDPLMSQIRKDLLIDSPSGDRLPPIPATEQLTAIPPGRPSVTTASGTASRRESVP